jgi:hypothetical protein
LHRFFIFGDDENSQNKKRGQQAIGDGGVHEVKAYQDVIKQRFLGAALSATERYACFLFSSSRKAF